jgi:hypothetical protein
MQKRYSKRRRDLEVNMLQKIVLGLVMAGLTAVAAAETVYKWVDSRGQIYYTDLPPRQADAKILGIFHEETGVVGEEEEEGSDTADGETPETPPATESASPDVSSDAAATVQADVANARVKQCKDAQERYKVYIESHRLFRQMPDGKRQYLTDQELTEARVRAKQAVDDYCN